MTSNGKVRERQTIHAYDLDENKLNDFILPILFLGNACFEILLVMSYFSSKLMFITRMLETMPLILLYVSLIKLETSSLLRRNQYLQYTKWSSFRPITTEIISNVEIAY